jgi:hypothetical protein
MAIRTLTPQPDDHRDSGGAAQEDDRDAHDEFAARPVGDLAPMGPRRRAAHPLAKALFAELRERPVADRVLVFNALSARLGPDTSGDEERAAMLDGMARCAMDRGAVTKRVYARWRTDQSDADSLHTWREIERVFGGWKPAKQALGATPAADVIGNRLYRLGPNLTRENVNAALRLWVAELDANPPAGHDGFLRQREFFAFCKREASSERPRLEHGPWSAGPIISLFGGWLDLLDEHGLVDRAARYWEAHMDPYAPASIEVALATDCADNPPTPDPLNQAGPNWNGSELTVGLTPLQDANGVVDTSRASATLSGYEGTITNAGTFDGTNYTGTVQSTYFAGLDFRCAYFEPTNAGTAQGWSWLNGYAPIKPTSATMSAAFVTTAVPATAAIPSVEGRACPAADVSVILQSYASCFEEFHQGNRWSLASGSVVVDNNNELAVQDLATTTWTRRWTRCSIAPELRALRIRPIGTLMSNNDCGLKAPQSDAYFVGQEMTWAGRFVYPHGRNSEVGWQFTDSAGFDSIGIYRCSRQGSWAQCTNAVGDSFKYRP